MTSRGPFPPLPFCVVPVTRPKQVFDNHEDKHGVFSEHRRQSVASKRWKPTYHAQNSLYTIRLSPVQSAFHPVQNMNNTYKSDEESTVQFLMAEELASTPVGADESLTAMESLQPARQPLLLNRALCIGRSALSIEEEKIFQSLDHLNQRLQNLPNNIYQHLHLKSNSSSACHANLIVMNAVQIRGLQTSSKAPGSNEGKISARDGSSTTPLWLFGVCNDKPVPALLRKSYNSGVDTALSSAHQLIQSSSQGECPKWVANGSGAEPDEGVMTSSLPSADMARKTQG
ncbi:hypothetical protein QYF61_009812 [Mycteria americana]|uniref:Uncharacterized protein n=1 Tax=Mycteria americana TaxID=33587 RepID=A0AAN7NRI5_MYCAM|nr:hypothetical protein QYF61_009812 [Mycteria americana]